MRYVIIDTGGSRSFPAGDPFLTRGAPDGEVAVLIGAGAGEALGAARPGSRAAVLVELGTECLGVHTGESHGAEGSNVVGFARFRLGAAEPSKLVELVRQPATPAAALEAAREVLEAAGLVVAVCSDFAGRIVDRLVRPYYNAALRRLDEGLATAGDLDATLHLGLGHPEGPIALLERTGLSHHFDVSQELFEAYGEPAYAAARRARVAAQRRGS